MKALRARRPDDLGALEYAESPIPSAGTGDVLVAVMAAGYTPGELAWPSTWVDRSGRDRTPSIPCHEFSGVVESIGFGAFGLSVGEEVYGLGDWYRDGAAAEFIAVEARNLARKPARVDHVAASTLPLAGLTAWQALFVHGGCRSGDRVLVLGASGGVGSLAVQLAQGAGARVVEGGPVAEGGRAGGRDAGPGTAFDLGDVSLVIDTVGGETLARCLAELTTEAATVVSIVDPSVALTDRARGIFFVVEPDRAILIELARLVDAGELEPAVARCAALAQSSELLRAKEHGEVRGKIAFSVAAHR